MVDSSAKSPSPILRPEEAGGEMQASHAGALPGKNAAIAAAPVAWRKTFIGGQRQHPDCSRLHDWRESGKLGVKEREKK